LVLDLPPSPFRGSSTVMPSSAVESEGSGGWETRGRGDAERGETGEMGEMGEMEELGCSLASFAPEAPESHQYRWARYTFSDGEN
ncbi:MAG: hypothetical protein SWY16_23930, partial [Cyanobacteriota bacterium]|nr:hypothetical protein [Cyanobacteriota bacterium]